MAAREDRSEQTLARAAYYAKVYPAENIMHAMFRSKMDVGFLLNNDIWSRRMSKPGKKEDLIAAILSHNPKEIHFGAVFEEQVGARGEKTKAFRGRPFVIDIDATDYQSSAPSYSFGGKAETFPVLKTSPRYSEKDAESFDKTWRFIAIAVKCITKMLAENFGFRNIVWDFSGCKGVHCNVFDERATQLSTEGRRAVYRYMMHDEGLFKDAYGNDVDGEARRRIRNAIYRKSLVLPQIYETVEGSMNHILEEQEMHLTANMQIMGEESGKKRKWSDYKAFSEIDAVVFALRVAMPRCDWNMASEGHMYKAPFSINSKTGKIQVPFDHRRVEEFKPLLSPTVFSDEAQIKPYVAFFASVTRFRPLPPAKGEKEGADEPPRGSSPERRRIPQGLSGLFKRI
jgi:DNA primase catalytic subunit